MMVEMSFIIEEDKATVIDRCIHRIRTRRQIASYPLCTDSYY